MTGLQHFFLVFYVAMSYLGHEVHTPLTLLLLQLQRNTSHRAPLDTLHEVGHKAGDLVPHPLGRDDRHLVANALVCVEVHRQTRVVLLDDGSRRLLHGLRADTLRERRTNTSFRQNASWGLAWPSRNCKERHSPAVDWFVATRSGGGERSHPDVIATRVQPLNIGDEAIPHTHIAWTRIQQHEGLTMMLHQCW